MENASKALLMAGGILIAILIISLLVLMVNQIGAYSRSQDDNKKNSQLAEFNLDFERYLDDKGIDGVDVISLINKVNDYNEKAKQVANGKKSTVTNYVDYNITMSVTISGLKNFNNKYAYTADTNQLFTSDSYTFDKSNTSNTLKQKLDDLSFADTSTGISIDNLKILSGLYKSSDKANSIENIKEKLCEIDSIKYNNWSATSTIKPTLETIILYRQYSEFKTSKFIVSQEADYENGQIKNLYLKFYK